MLINIFLLFLTAIATFILELLVIRKKYNDIIDEKYLTKIVLLVNFITNIALNSILIVMYGHTAGYTYLMLITIGTLEVAVVLVEYLMYKYAFRHSIKEGKIIKIELFGVTFLANLFSFVVGTFLIYLLIGIIVYIIVG